MPEIKYRAQFPAILRAFNLVYVPVVARTITRQFAENVMDTSNYSTDDSLTNDPRLILLDQGRLAKLLGCSARTLERQRLDGTGIPFVRVGRLVRYRLADVTNFLGRQLRISTSDAGPDID